MKKISYKVAKAIAIPYLKSIVSQKIGEENTEYGKVNVCDALQEYIIPERYMRGNGKEIWGWSDYCFRCVKPFPTYLELWLWLWREKDIKILNDDIGSANILPFCIEISEYEDPEKAIIAAIECLVDNKLLK